jgi:hypothetical protein
MTQAGGSVLNSTSDVDRKVIEVKLLLERVLRMSIPKEFNPGNKPEPHR